MTSLLWRDVPQMADAYCKASHLSCGQEFSDEDCGQMRTIQSQDLKQLSR